MNRKGDLLGDNLVSVILWIVFLILGIGIGWYIFNKIA